MANGLIQARQIIKRWEKCILIAYKPIPTDPWTIGWGSTGKNIVEGTVWTQEEADAHLINRTAILCHEIMGLLKIHPSDGELAAMISLADNIGLGAFKESTALREFNAGNIAEAADAFLLFKYSAGKIIPGLLNRRKDERNVFLS